MKYLHKSASMSRGRLRPKSNHIKATLLLLFLLTAAFLSLNATQSQAQGGGAPVLSNPYVGELASPVDTTGLPPAPEVTAIQGEGPVLVRDVMPLPRRQALQLEDFQDSLQNSHPAAQMPDTITNWEGISSTGVLPPDTNGQVGHNHYVQIVNSAGGAQVRVWNKAGQQLYNFGLENLWPNGNVCHDQAHGDPVVFYDQLANRWILTQFALPDPPYYQCFAVSKQDNPTNNPNDWWLYGFKVHDTKMNDYPKFGVWPDGYYMSANQFGNNGWAGAGVWVFDRASMLEGESATFQYFDVANMNMDYGGLLPSNLMGSTTPPNGAPNYYMSVDMDWHNSDDILHIFEFHTDWGAPANSTFRLVKDLKVAPFNWSFDGSGGSRDNWDIPQPDTDVELDSLSDRLMMHLWYRNYGDHESLVVNHTVNVGNGPDHAGIRWYEIRGGAVDTTLSDATIHQQGTYAPDAENRWMGSVAMDHVGNLAIGYSVSSKNTYPSIRYAGRLNSDPAGQLAQDEAEIIAGSGSQTHSAARWGDYSAISVDPADDCTFWYTTEYMKNTSSASWRTRVASFKFANCGQNITPTPTSIPPTATPTSIPPTATPTSIPPTATPTSIPPTATPTSVPPTATPTSTTAPPTPTPTSTSVPPTPTPTTVPPTPTPTPSPPPGSGALDIRIQDGGDDVEETQFDGYMKMSSSDLELGSADFFDFMNTMPIYGLYGLFDNMGTAQTVGLRFQNVNIPQGATITSAYLEFTVDETNSLTTIVTIYGEDSDDAAPFNSWGFYDLGTRPMTEATVEWDIPAWNQVDEQQQSPDIKSIIQEIVNRPGWSSGSSMVFAIEGTGRRVAKSYDGDSTAAPLLHVTYTTH